jgi:hypothetical protein
VLLSVYDPVNGALKGNATLSGGSTNPTPHNADQVLLASYDSVNGAVRFNCIVGCSGKLPNIAIVGSSATDQASLSSELSSSSGWTTTGWTGSYSAGFTNTSGNTSPLSYTISGMASGQYYVVSAAITSASAGSLTLSLGNTTVNPQEIDQLYWSANGTWTAGVLTTGTGAFTITPTSTFNGTVGSISVKQVTPISTQNLVTKDSTGATSVSVSQELQTLGSEFIGYPLGGAYNVYGPNNNPGQGGTDDVGLGPSALSWNVSGYNNTALGANSMQENVSGAQNSAVGMDALQDCQTCFGMTALGVGALQQATGAMGDVAVGVHAYLSLTSGNFNTSVGADSNHSTTGGSYNTAVGSRAMYQAANLQNNNTCVGYYCLSVNAEYSNTAIGEAAMELNATGYQNTAVGVNALFGASNSSAYSDTAVGLSALGSVTSAADDEGFGAYALDKLTSGNYNVAVGYGANYDLTSGVNNVSVGHYASYTNSTSNNNTSVGFEALFNGTGGSNTAVGYEAGYTDTSGTANTYLGYGADVSTTGITNATAIGNGAKVATSNTMVFGNSSVTDVYFGSSTPSAQIHATNSVLSGHLNQTATASFAGSCSMSSGTTCTITLGAAFTSTPLCFVTPQGTTAAYAACSVSGTTVTITASASNSLTWGALVVGNPN